MAEGRGVTAKVRWVSKAAEEGRSRWIHCTPLLGGNGQIGVWMVVIIDEHQADGALRPSRQAPPIAASPIAASPSYSQAAAQKESQNRPGRMQSKTSSEERRYERRTTSQPVRNGYVSGTNGHNSVEASVQGSVQSHSPTSASH